MFYPLNLQPAQPNRLAGVEPWASHYPLLAIKSYSPFNWQKISEHLPPFPLVGSPPGADQALTLAAQTLALGVFTNFVMPSSWTQSLIEHGLHLGRRAIPRGEVESTQSGREWSGRWQILMLLSEDYGQ